MPKLINTVILSAEEISRLNALTRKGAGATAREIMHANILLLTNDGLSDRKKGIHETAELFGISPNTVNNVRKLYVDEGFAAAIGRKTRITAPMISKITGEFEAQVIGCITKSGVCDNWNQAAFHVLHFGLCMYVA